MPHTAIKWVRTQQRAGRDRGEHAASESRNGLGWAARGGRSLMPTEVMISASLLWGMVDPRK